MKRKNNTSPRTGNRKIICINTGIIPIPEIDGTFTEYQGDKCPIELYETYTTPGPVATDDGLICYPINEYGGQPMLSQRFVEYKGKRNVVSKPNNSH